MRNMNDLVRQANIIQNKLQALRQEAANSTYEATSGGGIIKAVVNGNQEVTALTIDPKALEGCDVEMLQDLVISAVNEAMRIAKESLEREMSAISGGIKIPGIF